jgi:hypothetical protein
MNGQYGQREDISLADAIAWANSLPGGITKGAEPLKSLSDGLSVKDIEIVHRAVTALRKKLEDNLV